MDKLNSIIESHWIIAPISIIQAKLNTTFPVYNIRHYYYKCYIKKLSNSAALPP